MTAAGSAGEAVTPGQAARVSPLLSDNRDVMDALMMAIGNPGKFLNRAPAESYSSWQRRAIVEHVAPVIIAAQAAIAAQQPPDASGTSRERRALKALDELFKIDSDPCNPWNQRAMKIIARGLLDTVEPQPAPELAAAMRETRAALESAIREVIGGPCRTVGPCRFCDAHTAELMKLADTYAGMEGK